MADRYFYKQQSIQKEMKTLFAEVAIGASGAPTLSTTIRSGFTSITRTGAGVYDVVLDDTYNGLYNIHIGYFESTSDDLTFQITARSASATGGATFTFESLAAGVPTDPNNGSALLITVWAKNSSVNF